MKRHMILNRLRSEFPNVTWEEGPRTILFRADVGDDAMMDVVDISKYVDNLYHLEIIVGGHIFFTPISFDVPNWRKEFYEKLKGWVVDGEHSDECLKKAISILRNL